MRIRRITKQVRNHYLEDRAAHLFAVVQALEVAGRPVPGHIRRELLLLRPHWGKRALPPVIRRAAKLIGGGRG